MNSNDFSLYLNIKARQILKQVEDGTLDPLVVKRVFQNLLDGKLSDLSFKPPAWWRPASEQMKIAEKIWPGIEIPIPPVDFQPQTDTEVLLLHVSLPYFGQWIQPVSSHLNLIVDESMKDNRNIRRSPNTPARPTLAWVAFDPEHGRNERPNILWRHSNLAGTEVLSAMVMFPDWPKTWEEFPFIVNMSGFQFKDSNDNWRHVPSIQRWGDTYTLSGSVDAETGLSCVSPSVREL